MALLSEKEYGFPGLISVASGYRSFDLDQMPTNASDITPGMLLEKDPDDVETGWQVVTGDPGGNAVLGLAMKFLAAGTLAVGEEDRRMVILLRDAEYAFEKMVFDPSYTPNAAKIEEFEDTFRTQGVVLRSNAHDLQNGTT